MAPHTHFAPRPRFQWRVGRRTVALGERTLIMGVLNVTPDSFSDGGVFLSPERAVEHGLEMLADGADIVDIGGESTRPGATPLLADEELQRVLPVIAALRRAAPDALLSVDTSKATVAEEAVRAGADIVNDVSGFLWDVDMAATCSRLECGVLLMHTRGRPQSWRELPGLALETVVPLVRGELSERLRAAARLGIAADRIVLDPGFGFGKLGQENYALLRGFAGLHTLGRPLLAGVSRKGFLRQTVEGLRAANIRNRQTAMAEQARHTMLNASLAATTAAILAGAHIVRVHDVRETREAAAVADAVLG